jgi:hypothetical protein
MMRLARSKGQFACNLPSITITTTIIITTVITRVLPFSAVLSVG